ncbi:MAG: hypothetical protein HXK58_04650 [Campylobacter concisus]|jgi:hypothetical protein|uniref:hypothetical protein n=2 Tax=Campylobacter concisus TaxID=199 RepID=UPI000CD9B9A7|nr:hypothetical protein [Campylobacter concisus]MBF0897566.1 hypothetical protein [Campylobacter concisus]
MVNNTNIDDIIKYISVLEHQITFNVIEIQTSIGIFNVLKVNFDFNSILKSIVQSLIKSEYTMDANQNTSSRLRSKKFDKQLEGILGEIAVALYLKQFISCKEKGGCPIDVIRYDDVRQDGFKSSKGEFDIKIVTKSLKEFKLEIRTSVNYKYPLNEDTLKKLDTICGYTNSKKQNESDSDFYIRPLFQVKNYDSNLDLDHIHILDMILDKKIELYIIGGVDQETILKKGKTKTMGQSNTEYNTVAIIDGYDIKTLTKTIRAIVCKDS